MYRLSRSPTPITSTQIPPDNDPKESFQSEYMWKNIKGIYVILLIIIICFCVIKINLRSLSHHSKTGKKPKSRMSLHKAVANNSKALIELIISEGADINEKDIIYSNIQLLFFNKIIFNQ